MTDNNTQSTPKTDKELFDAMSDAVSKGDSTEISRLMTVEVEPETRPDADTDDDAGKPDPADEAGKDTDTAQGDDEQSEPSKDSSPPEAASKDAASANANTEGLSPEQLQLLLAKVHKLESDAGRVGHLQSKIAQLERQLQKTAASVKPTEPAETEEQRKFRERIKALKEIDPEQAETLEFLANQSALKEAPVKHEDAVDLEREELLKSVQIVESVHPDALPIFEHNSWKQWKSQLSQDKREWAESHEPGKVIVALNAFKQDMALLQQQQTKAPEAKGGDPASDKPDAGNDAVKTARERKLQDGGANRNTPIKNQGVVDESALFDEYYTKIQKEAGIK